MLRILLFLAVSLGGGSLLARLSVATGFPTGSMGAAALIAWAFLARGHWTRLEKETGTEPGPPERALWLQCAGGGVLLGHLVAAMLHADVDLRLGSGNTLAIDSWTMILAVAATGFIFRQERKFRDERDKAISARGVKAGYSALIFLSLGLAFYLAFAPPNYRAGLSHFMIGNMLIALILSSYLAQLIVCLQAYARDAIYPSMDGRVE